MSYAKYGATLSFVINSIDFVKGQLCFRSTFYMALLNKSNLFTSLACVYEGEGENRACVIKGVRKKGGEAVESRFSFKEAKELGFTDTKQGYKKPLWKVQPDLMLKYRAYTYFIRAHAPELLNGMYTKEERIDIENTK